MDVPHAEEINFTYSKIHSTLSNLNSRIKNVVDTNQDTFISAYKDTMDQVSTEIKDMKAKVATERLKQKSQEKIDRLTKERDWF